MKAKKLLAALVSMAMLLGMFSVPTFAEDDTGTVRAGKTITLAEFVKAVEESGCTYDGQGVTVEWSPSSACTDNRGPENHDCLFAPNAAPAPDGNNPSRAQNANAQFWLFKEQTDISVSNVNFKYIPADFTLCANSAAGYKGSFKAEDIKNAEFQFQNTGSVSFTNCTFDAVIVSPFSCRGSSAFTGCTFENVYDAYAIKDVYTPDLTVSGCSFENCGGAIYLEGSEDKNEIVITNNTFTNIDTESCAAEGKAGTRGLIQFSANGDYSNAAIDISSNTSIGDAQVLRQLNPTVTADVVDVEKLEEENDFTGEIFVTGTSLALVVLDRNGDGTEYKSFATLEEALEEAQNGSIISLAAGEHAGDLTIDKSITLKGQEGAVIDGELVVNADNVTIEDLTLAGYGNLMNDGSPHSVYIRTGKDGIAVKNCVFAIDETSDKVKGITTEANVTNLTVEGNTFNENYETAVYLNSGATGAKLLNNKVNATGFGFRLVAAQNAEISGNIFDVKGLWDHAALEFRPNGAAINQNITVENNVFDGNSNIDFYDLGAFGEEKLDLSKNYWGGSMPGNKIPSTEAKHTTVNSYYTALDENTGLPDEDSLVQIVEELEDVTKHIELEAVEGTNQVNVYITGSLAEGETAYVKNLIAAHLNLTVTDGFSITGVEAVDSYWCVDVVGQHDYLIRAQGREGTILTPEAKVLSGDKIHIATVTIGGYGKGTLTAAGGLDTENDVEQKTDENNIVVSGNLEETSLDFSILPATQDLTINVAFPNEINNNAADYQAMTVTVSGGNLDEAIVYHLGTDSEDCTFGTVALSGTNYNGYTVEVTDTLLQNTAYTVTVEGEGYRTARYTVNMQEANKELTFWNNVMDADTVIEKDNDSDSAKAKVTFLAGDIVKDNNINIYDLSAVVSYFGTDNDVTAASDYAKYDLNRDGKIDSKDVAMVLVSWGN